MDCIRVTGPTISLRSGPRRRGDRWLDIQPDCQSATGGAADGESDASAAIAVHFGPQTFSLGRV
jgi:hypothetical protein